MKINNLLILAVFIFSISTNVVAAQRKQKVVSNREDRPLSLGVTHILPSAFVIPGGTLILGTTAGFGLFDFMDVTTNLYLDFQSVFNVRSKVNLLKDEDYALGISVGYITQTVKTYDATGLVSTSQTSSSVTPGQYFE